MSDASHAVSYSWSSLGRAMSDGLDAGTFLEVRPSGRKLDFSPDLLREVNGAARAADLEVDSREFVSGPALFTAKGRCCLPVFCEGKTATRRRWLDVFVAGLQDAGISGKVVAPSSLGRPDLVGLRPTASDSRAYPAAFLGFRLERFPPKYEQCRWDGWLVDATTTRKTAEWVASFVCGSSDGECWAQFVTRNVQLAPDQAAEFLANAPLVTAATCRLIFRHTSDLVMAETAASWRGELTLFRAQPSASWHTLVDGARDALLMNPAATDVGLVHNSGWPLSWSALEETHGHKPPMMIDDFRANRHLWDEYVPDAYGINLLTEKHLAHAHDLSAWSVEEVVPGRFLVEAKDLAAWYEAKVVAEDIVTKARADFGEMILGWDAVEANPGPYTVYQGRRLTP